MGLNAPRTYRVRYNDTLSSIASKFYGDPRLGIVIYNHNKHYIANVNQLHPGQVLVIPYVKVSETAIQ